MDRTPTLGDLCDCRLGIRVFENVHCFEGPERDDLFARGGREGIRTKLRVYYVERHLLGGRLKFEGEFYNARLACLLVRI